MSLTQKQKSRRTLLLVLVAFILPVVLAKLALTQQWFNYGVTNQGSLIENELTLAQLGLEDEILTNTWLVIYSLPAQCDRHCEAILLTVNNSYKLLGKDMPRVKAIALTQQTLTEKQLAKISINKWTIMPTPSLTKNILTHSQVLIVDTLGNVVLTHQPPENADLLPGFGKAILEDFKKLLKYSRIG